ncbi:hypothetical protein [Pedococcus sp.]|jgi:hypothetical protein|uniref:hypothetical protein n=1 Tax=Pedococcus sp. TaxID=2860345 RepID=UPI002E0DAFD1|nr:hypothetical protein [Pedococcus sp.]
MLNSPTRLRAVLAATALAGGAIVGCATAASAATGTTITLSPSDVVATGDPLTASGTCVTGSRTAVVTVVQNSTVLDQTAANLSPSHGYSVTLDVSQGTLGPATVTVDCYQYPTAAPVGSASADVGIDDGSGGPNVPVTISPSSVHIGGQITITATCPAGTPTAEVLAGSGTNSQPFFDKTVTPAVDGTLSVTTTVAAGPLVAAGPGGAVVLCGTPNNPTGFGFADLTILAALPGSAVPPATPSAPAGPAESATPPASAVPTLAYTGSDALPMTAMALGLLAIGGVMLVTRRRLRA